jgi:SNF2 family DNA or RNA helicase
MELGAFVSLEDISDALPPYEEEVINVEMDPVLAAAYESLEEDIKAALEEHRGNSSVVSTGLNALMLYGDRPFGLGTLYGYATSPETGERERFVISEPADLDQEFVYAKERRLVEEVKTELRQGRRVQIFAVYTQKRDVTQRLKNILSREGIRVEVLTTAVPPEAREAWYERQLKAGMQVCIAHPRLVATGLDLLGMPTILFYESGYSIYVLRQASRRSWRIGQKHPVKVKFLAYAGTMQENCLRLMGKKLLVSLAMEGKFANQGLQALDDDDDILTAMARELVTEKGVGQKADALWREIQQQHTRLLGTTNVVAIAQPEPTQNGPCLPESDPPLRPLQSESAPGALVQLVLSEQRAARRSRHDNDAQLSLAF